MFLLMTDGAWRCQGTVGQACASSMPPAPLLCTPLHTNMRTLPCFLSWPISLQQWHTAPPFLPTPTHTPSVGLSLNHSPSFCLTHNGLLLVLLCPLRRCLWTDIRGAGRTIQINRVCDGIKHTRPIICYMITIQDENINSLWGEMFSIGPFWTASVIRRWRETHFHLLFSSRKRSPDQLMCDGGCVMIPFIFMEVVTGFWRWFRRPGGRENPLV